MATSRSFVKSLTASSLAYPLYDHIANPAKCYFSLEPWKVSEIDDSGNAQAYPAAITKDTSFSLCLSSVEGLSAPYTISGLIGQWTAFSATTDSMSADITIQNPQVASLPKSLPWSLGPAINWTIKGSNEVEYSCTMPIEVYVLPVDLPPFFNLAGIPLALLRLERYLPKWMETPERQADGQSFEWSAFAIQSLFSDPRLEYETFDGASNYITFKQSSVDNIHCWLDLWLTDLATVRLGGTPDDPRSKHTMNCYDLASIGQILVSLGNDAANHKVNMIFLQPFGFIKPTHLIGRREKQPNPNNPDNLCNNPFYGSSDRFDRYMLCDPQSKTRSQFGNHMFLSIEKEAEKYILDACAGPQIGTTLLADYPAAVMDTSVEGGRFGTVANMKHGNGVEAMITSRCFERKLTPEESGDTVLDRLAAAMKDLGQWNQPYLAAPAGGSYGSMITATWVFIPNNDPSENITVNIMKFSGEGDAKEMFQKRVTDIPDWKPGSTLYEGYSNAVDGSIRIFYDDQRNYVAMIDTRIGDASSTSSLKNKLHDVLNDCILINPPAVSYIEGVWNTGISPYKVGEIVTVSIRKTKEGAKYWRGFNIEAKDNNVLFMGNVSQSEDATHGHHSHFDFLMRYPGKTTVELTLYGGNFESEKRSIDFEIRAD